MTCRLKTSSRLQRQRDSKLFADFDEDCEKCQRYVCTICTGHPSWTFNKAETSKKYGDFTQEQKANNFTLKMIKSLVSKRTWVIGPEIKVTFKTLDLRKKRIKDVPMEILRLPDFRAIRLDSNENLQDVTILGQIPNLRIAILKNCDVQRLPNESGALLALELNNNQNVRNFAALERYARLQYLNIGRCLLNKLPDSVQSLRSLRVLCLDDNPLEGPLDLSFLKLLQVLLMKNCNLTSIPNSVFVLKDLLYLSLEQNKILHVTRSVLNIPCLMVLSIYGNRGITITPSIWKCPHLKRINVDLHFATKGLNSRVRRLINVWKDVPSAWWKQI